MRRGGEASKGAARLLGHAATACAIVSPAAAGLSLLALDRLGGIEGDRNLTAVLFVGANLAVMLLVASIPATAMLLAAASRWPSLVRPAPAVAAAAGFGIAAWLEPLLAPFLLPAVPAAAIGVALDRRSRLLGMQSWFGARRDG